MARRPSRRDLSTGILVVLLAGVLVSNVMVAGATHQPANKAVASGRKLIAIGPDLREEILSATMKTSKPQDLVFSVSLECSIITQTYIAGGPAADADGDTQSAEGRVRVWVEVDGTPVKIVAIQSTNTDEAPNTQSAAGVDSDKVTFCNRYHEQFVKDAEEDEGGNNPTGDGTDTNRTYLRTKTANAFNWVYLNAGSGVHTFKVYAEFSHPNSNSNTACAPEPAAAPTTGTCSNAYVGNRTLMIFPERFANDAVVE